MSAATLAVAPLRRRTLERTGMTPEQELELLIVEQRRDDTYFVDRPPFVISLDAPAPQGGGVMYDLIGVDEDGEIVSWIPPSETHLSAPTHGTRHAYTRLKCRCLKCCKENSRYIREYRARRRAGA